MNKDAMKNPEAMEVFVELGKSPPSKGAEARKSRGG
jgi:hypothetical protein